MLSNIFCLFLFCIRILPTYKYIYILIMSLYRSFHSTPRPIWSRSTDSVYSQWTYALKFVAIVGKIHWIKYIYNIIIKLYIWFQIYLNNLEKYNSISENDPICKSRNIQYRSKSIHVLWQFALDIMLCVMFIDTVSGLSLIALGPHVVYSVFSHSESGVELHAPCSNASLTIPASGIHDIANLH